MCTHPPAPSPHLTHARLYHLLQLEKQLAAAERCTLELKELSASLTGVRQEDVELLKVGVALSLWRGLAGSAGGLGLSVGGNIPALPCWTGPSPPCLVLDLHRVQPPPQRLSLFP